MKITQIQCPSCLGQLTVDWETGKQSASIA